MNPVRWEWKGPPTRGPSRENDLLDLDARALILELLLDLLRLVLGHALLHGLAAGLDQILRLFEPEPGERADLLDDVDLLVAGRLQDDGELGLLLDRSGRSCARSGGHRHRRGGRHAPLVFK